MNKQLKLLRKYSTSPRLPPCDFIPQKYQGLSSEKIQTIRKARLNPGIGNYYTTPSIFHQGHKQWLFDVDGKRYLDMFGGICTVSVGHCHPKITEAVHEQMQILGHVSNVYAHPKIHEYAERLGEKMPGDLKVIYFVNSGSEANDLAILLARTYTNRFDIWSLKNCYHGMSYQTMGLTSNTCYKYPVPQPPGFIKVMNPDVFRGIWGGQNCRDSPVQTNRSCFCSSIDCEAGRKYLEQFQKDLEYESKLNLAAFFAESIQGVGGTVQFPRNYLKGVYNIVKENGGVFISDEVQTGFGRTGETFWGFEMHGIVPDIVTMAKGIGNGYPLAAVITTREVANAFGKANHFNTFGGNPIACTVGMAVLDIIEEERLQENSLTVGTHLLLELEKLKKEFSVIGDVRGKGLMIGIEMIDSENGHMKPTQFMKLWEHCRDHGLILGKGGIFGNVFRIKPPMCVTKEDADFTVEVLRNALCAL